MKDRRNKFGRKTQVIKKTKSSSRSKANGGPNLQRKNRSSRGGMRSHQSRFGLRDLRTPENSNTKRKRQNRNKCTESSNGKSSSLRITTPTVRSRITHQATNSSILNTQSLISSNHQMTFIRQNTTDRMKAKCMASHHVSHSRTITHSSISSITTTRFRQISSSRARRSTCPLQVCAPTQSHLI